MRFLDQLALTKAGTSGNREMSGTFMVDKLVKCRGVAGRIELR